MMILLKRFFVFILFITIISCNNSNTTPKATDSVVLKYQDIPAERSVVNPKTVKIYAETVKSFETTDAFQVDLFETKETFNYLIKIQYKQIVAEDTLHIPNFGMQPSVEIKKGDTRPSCIVGFFDVAHTFKESKLIYFDDNKLKIKVLKYYSVSAVQDTIK